MDGADIGLTLFIIIIFVILQLTNILAIGVKNIKDNWPLYRCNPMLMPFAQTFGHDPMMNFTYCIQNMNLNFMPYLLDPLSWFINNFVKEGQVMGKQITGLLGLSTQVESGITNFIDNGFSIFVNLFIVFQEIIIKIRDTFSKMVGIVTTLLYVLGGLQVSVVSLWAGPIGGFTRSIARLSGHAIADAGDGTK